MAVDMFAITVIASGLTTLVCLICTLIYIQFGNSGQKNSIEIQIDYYILGAYNERNKNIIYESLSWLISEQIKKLDKGSFILDAQPNLNNEEKNAIPYFSILPENDHEISVEFKGNKFNIKFIKYKSPENNNTNINNDYNYTPLILKMTNEKPSIVLSIKTSKLKVDDISTLLDNITRKYLEIQKRTNGCFRYENNQTRWQRIQKLSCRGLDSVALDEKQELLLKKELDIFVKNKSFYEKIGMPYRRGILLYGKPGTGKTSLINAISSYLSRDIYHLNLKMIKDDSELSAVFSGVPSNQLIVLEDVDAQSNVLHKRNTQINNNFIFDEKINNNNFNELSKKSPNDRNTHFSLSAFLACLDGHTISEGNIIIMTTNHVDFLDPACIRPGRMDVHLELGYCTHYQLNKMFKTVINNSGIPDYILKNIPEKILSPCEVMTLISLYHKDQVEVVINELNELVNKYKTKSDNIDIE
jgi:SpoVK/Ycf46/Vps4 family AAA+-type ATPase